MTTHIWQFFHLDGTKATEPILGLGGTGVVIQREECALKIPQLSREINDESFIIEGFTLRDEE